MTGHRGYSAIIPVPAKPRSGSGAFSYSTSNTRLGHYQNLTFLDICLILTIIAKLMFFEVYEYERFTYARA